MDKNVYSNELLYKYWITGEISNGVKIIKKITNPNYKLIYIFIIINFFFNSIFA
jgi:hypothetical protein